VVLVSVSSIFGFGVLCTIFYNLCSSEEISVHSVSLYRLFLLLATIVTNGYFFIRSYNLVFDEVKNIEALQGISECSGDPDTKFTTDDVYNKHKLGVQFTKLGTQLCIALSLFWIIQGIFLCCWSPAQNGQGLNSRYAEQIDEETHRKK
jgi:hypothetical protein